MNQSSCTLRYPDDVNGNPTAAGTAHSNWPGVEIKNCGNAVSNVTWSVCRTLCVCVLFNTMLQSWVEPAQHCERWQPSTRQCIRQLWGGCQALLTRMIFWFQKTISNHHGSIWFSPVHSNHHYIFLCADFNDCGNRTRGMTDGSITKSMESASSYSGSTNPGGVYK